VKLLRHSVDPRFENAYLAVRSEEGRVYTQAQILKLPETDAGDPNAAEWKRRAKSTKRFIDYVRSKAPVSLLDLGCGNGWMMNKLFPHCSSITGVDVNLKELEQAESIFKDKERVRLMYGDVFSVDLSEHYDVILIYAAIQYFPDLHLLMNRLSTFLKPTGSIHILDSPFYEAGELTAAKHRTKFYYGNRNKPEMVEFYHHHSWEQIRAFKPVVHYNPNSFLAKLKNKLNPDSPFPWLEIKKEHIV